MGSEKPAPPNEGFAPLPHIASAHGQNHVPVFNHLTEKSGPLLGGQPGHRGSLARIRSASQSLVTPGKGDSLAA
jgi:hypothetical protein